MTEINGLAGMPVGPLALADETAIDLGWKIHKAAEADLGHEDGVRPKARTCLMRSSVRELWPICSRTDSTSARSFIAVRCTGESVSLFSTATCLMRCKL